jgi:hypothetical protein
VKDLGEPRDVSQPALSEAEGFFATHYRAFGSLPYQTAPLPHFSLI